MGATKRWLEEQDDENTEKPREAPAVDWSDETTVSYSSYAAKFISVEDREFNDAKDKLLNDIDMWFEKVSSSDNFIHFADTKTLKRYHDLVDLVSASTERSALRKARADFLEASKLERKLTFLRSFFGAGMYLYCLVAAAFFTFKLFDIPHLAETYFQVQNSQIIFAYGISGAMLSLLSKFEKRLKPDSDNFAHLSIRLAVGILVPLILAGMLFGNPSNSNQTVEISTKAIAFGCGYSSTIVSDILSKIVEKATQVIKAL